MPGFMPGIHAFLIQRKQGVDGRDKPGHDAVISWNKQHPSKKTPPDCSGGVFVCLSQTGDQLP
jgi:hypothetical protein